MRTPANVVPGGGAAPADTTVTQLRLNAASELLAGTRGHLRFGSLDAEINGATLIPLTPREQPNETATRHGTTPSSTKRSTGLTTRSCVHASSSARRPLLRRPSWCESWHRPPTIAETCRPSSTATRTQRSKPPASKSRRCSGPRSIGAPGGDGYGCEPAGNPRIRHAPTSNCGRSERAQPGLCRREALSVTVLSARCWRGVGGTRGFSHLWFPLALRARSRQPADLQKRILPS